MKLEASLTSLDAASEPLASSDVVPPSLQPDPTDLQSSNHRKLEGTAMHATMWTIVAYGASQVLRLGNNVILAHLLVPEYFGLMTLMNAFVLGMVLLSDIGLQPSVVGSPRGDEPIFLNTAWTVQIVRGLLLWCFALILSYPISLYYRDHRILMLLPVLALTMVLNGFASSNLLTAARHMGVRRLLVIEFSSTLFGILVIILWAELSPSIWALVAGTLAGAAMKTLLSHIPAVLPGLRNRLAWDKSCLHSLVHIGRWILIGTGFYFFASQADRLILGKLVSFSILGVYGIAFTISDIPRQVINQFCTRVGFPFIAKMAHLPAAEFRTVVMKYRFYALCAGALILSIVVNAGGPLVQLLYDRRYAAASWMVPIFALGLWHTLLYSTTRDIMLARGKPMYNTIGTGLYCATIFVALPISFHFYGLVGAVVSVAAGDLPVYIVLVIGAERQKVSLWRQDILATGVFLILVSLGYGLRHLIA